MRCGTTFLSSSLARHPQVFLSQPKEPNFFNDDSHYSRGLDWYLTHFEGAGDAIAVGEATTRYSKVTEFPSTAGRIARHLPTARLIYIVRHPLERIESNWKHYLRWGDSQLDFTAALEAHPEWVDTSCYWRQINAYREHFADEQILILFLEELRRHPDSAMRQCYEFLGVDASFPLAEGTSPVNESAGRVVEGRLLRKLRKRRALRLFGQWTPRWLRGAARRMLSYEVPPTTPLWNEAVRRATLTTLAPDTARFLEFCNRPPDYWPLRVPEA
jgi:hypothetical protein